jgi:hypothetical protein
MAGSIVHLEIPADDTGQSLAFWGGLFGWSLENYPGGQGEYHMGQISETSGVAITNMEPGKRGTRPYFDVDDIEVGVARVSELGGTAAPKMPVPGMGWFSPCTDPHGNEFGLWQTDESAPVPAA